MKILRHLVLFTAFAFLASCAPDDVSDAPERTTVVTTLDLMTTIEDDVTNGTVVAKVKGRTNNGQVSFAITSQLPGGVFQIDEIFGELIVADEALIDAATTPEVNLVVTITNGSVSKTSNVNITIIPAPVDNDGDGVFNDTDPDDTNPCVPQQNPGYDDYDLTNPIWANADCDADGTSNGDEVAGNTDPYVNDSGCDSTVNTSIWEGNFTITQPTPFGDEVSESIAPAVAGCGILIIPNPGASPGCPEGGPEILFTLTPDFPGATTGTLEALEQPYDCAFADPYVATGTYDEIEQTLTIMDNRSFAGSIITPRE